MKIVSNDLTPLGCLLRISLKLQAMKGKSKIADCAESFWVVQRSHEPV